MDLSHNSLCGLAHGIGKYEASGIELLANALTYNRALTALNVLGNELDKDAARMLAAIAKSRRISLCGIGPSQKRVNFYYKGLKAPDAILIAADLQIRPALTILELPSNEVGPDGAGINHSTGKGTYTSAGIRAIAEAVRASTVCAVTSLNLKYNDIKPTDIEMLREAVDERSGSFVRRSKEVLGRKGDRRVVEMVLDL